MRAVDPDRRDADRPGARHSTRSTGRTPASPTAAATRSPRSRPTTSATRRPRPPSTVIVDNSAPTRRRHGADRRSRAAQYQHYDAPSKTLWLNATGRPARSSSPRTPPIRTPASRRSTSPPSSARARRAIPVGPVHLGRPYSFSSPARRRARRRSRRRTASPTRPPRRAPTRSRSTSTAPRRRRTRSSRSTTAPTTTRPGTPARPAARARPRAASAAPSPTPRSGAAFAVKLSIKDRTTGKYYDGAAFTQASQTPAAHGDARRHELELRARPEQAHLAARLRGRGATRSTTSATSRRRPQIRFTYGSDVGAPTHDALAHRRDARVALPGGGRRLQPLLRHRARRRRLHAPRRRDRPERRRHGHLPGSLGDERLRRLGRHFDERRQRRSVRGRLVRLHASRARATTPPGPKTVTSVDLRSNSGDDDAHVPARQRDARPAARSTVTPPLDVERLRHDDEPHGRPPRLHGRRSGSGVASSTLTVASALARERHVRQLRLRGARRRRRLHRDRRHLLPLHAHGHRPRRQRRLDQHDVKVDTTAPSQPERRLHRPLERQHVRQRRRHALLPPVGRRRVHGERERLDRRRVRDRDATRSRRSRLRRRDADRQPLDVTFNGASTGSGSYTVHSTNNAGLDSADATYSVTADSTAPAAAADRQRQRAARRSSYLTSGADGRDRDDAVHRRRLRPRERSADGRSPRRSRATAAGRFGSTSRRSAAARPTASRTATATASRSPRPTTSATPPSLTTTVKVDTTAPVAPAISFSGLSSRQHVRQRHDALLPPVGRRHVHGERDRRERSGDRDQGRQRRLHVLRARRLPAARRRRATRSTSPSTARATAAAPQSVSAVNNAGVSSTPATPFTVTRRLGRADRRPALDQPVLGLADRLDREDALHRRDLRHRDERRHALEPAGAVVARRLPGRRLHRRDGRAARATRCPTDGQCYQYTLTGTDNVGNTATLQTIVLVDTTGPAGGSVSYVDGLASLSSVSVDWVTRHRRRVRHRARSQIERATATLTGSTCGSFGGFTHARRGPTVSPTVDSSVAAGNCYAYRHRRHEQRGRRLDVLVAVGREDHERLADHRLRRATRPALPRAARRSGSARRPRTCR